MNNWYLDSLEIIEDDKSIFFNFDMFDQKNELNINKIWDLIRQRKDKVFYIYSNHFQQFNRCKPSDWNRIQRNIRMITMIENVREFLYLDIQHRYLFVSPVNKKVNLPTEITSDLVECIVASGDEKGDEICSFEWIVDLREECKKRHISFVFYSTGNVLEKDNKIYHIPFKKQHEQAKKASLDLAFDAWYEKDVFLRLSKSKFRSSFHLKQKDIDYINKVSIYQIERHAHDFVQTRLKDANISNDGKQTPTKGHPVFIAQHATACCCRGCLKKWHNIDNYKELSQSEEDYIVKILMRWIQKEMEKYK